MAMANKMELGGASKGSRPKNWLSKYIVSLLLRKYSSPTYMNFAQKEIFFHLFFISNKYLFERGQNEEL